MVRFACVAHVRAAMAHKHDAGCAGSSRVYVGNLDWGVEEADLRAFFADCGNVLDANVAYHPDGRSKVRIALAPARAEPCLRCDAHSPSPPPSPRWGILVLGCCRAGRECLRAACLRPVRLCRATDAACLRAFASIVEFQWPREAEAAIQRKHDAELNGRKVTCRVVRTGRPPTRGRCTHALT